MKLSLFIYLFVQLSQLFAQSETVSQKQMIDNLTAFTKLYGYVRFFHPSDEAAAADWNKLALYGVGKVKNAKNTGELKQSLNEIFLPLAPTMQLLLNNEKPVPLKKYDDTANLKTVAWQHFGVQFDNSNIYRSTRVNRDKLKPVSGNGAYQMIEEFRTYKDKYFKFSAYVQTDLQRPNFAELSFSAYSEAMEIGERLSIDHTSNGKWLYKELHGKFSDNPTYISYYAELIGCGTLWVDNVRLDISDDSVNWETVDVPNPGFELLDEKSLPVNWNLGGSDYIYSTDKKIKKEGQYSLSVKNNPGYIPGSLFSKIPVYGEIIRKPINKNLSVYLPLVLYADSNGTLPRTDTLKFRAYSDILNTLSVDSFGTKDMNTKLASVVILWNVLQNFYPYFDVVHVDWPAEINRFLMVTLTDTLTPFQLTLRKMLHKLQDGHMTVTVNNKLNMPHLSFPFLTDYIEDKLIIIRTEDTALYRTGDVILKINGEEAETFYKRNEQYPSGTLRWRRAILKTNLFNYEIVKDTLDLLIQRDKQVIPITAVRNCTKWIWDVPESRIKKINDSIIYVNLNEVTMKEIDSVQDELSRAKGIIFDLRAYPNGNHNVLQHLTDSALWCARWNIPQAIYPDRENLAGWSDWGRWDLKPKLPRFKGNPVFIISARSISYCETVLGIVEHYKLGELVGETTAGTNGNVNSVWLPGGYNVRWTGMKVLKHDGSQHHLIGIKPTYPVKRTIKAIREGRDEYLEKAIEILTEKK